MSRHTVLLIALLLSALLAACAPKVWTRAGASQDDFNRDRYACLQESQQQYSGAYVNSAGGAASSGMTTNPLLFNACMNARGWALESAAQPQEQSGQRDTLKDSMERFAVEAKYLCASDALKLFFAKTGCSPDNTTLAQMADTSTVSDLEKPAVSNAQIVFHNRSVAIQNAQRTYGGEKGAAVATALAHNMVLSDKILLDLYEGKISWGEYNHRRKDAWQPVKDAMNQAAGAK